MKIEKNAYVALDYTLTIDSGEVIDQSVPGSPLTFIHGMGQMIPGLEAQIMGMGEGEAAKITVESDDGYGPSRPELYREVPRDNFPDDAEIKPGAVFQAMGPHGSLAVSVRGVEGDMVTIDLNHPLAGQRLHFEIKVAEVREPTEAEIEEMNQQCSPTACGGCGGTCN